MDELEKTEMLRDACEEIASESQEAEA